MSEVIKRRPGNPAMVRGGPSLNPAGRPKSGLSLADALRSRFPPERIAELAEKLATSAESEQVRLAALQMVADRTAGRVTDRLAITAGDAEPERNWSAMPLDERRELLARLRAVPELGSGE